jgi:uncharacterized membrane protein YhdT
MFLKTIIVIAAFVIFAYALALAFQGTLSVPAMFELPQRLSELCQFLYHYSVSAFLHLNTQFQ